MILSHFSTKLLFSYKLLYWYSVTEILRYQDMDSLLCFLSLNIDWSSMHSAMCFKQISPSPEQLTCTVLLCLESLYPKNITLKSLKTSKVPYLHEFSWTVDHDKSLASMRLCMAYVFCLVALKRSNPIEMCTYNIT